MKEDCTVGQEVVLIPAFAINLPCVLESLTYHVTDEKRKKNSWTKILVYP